MRNARGNGPFRLWRSPTSHLEEAHVEHQQGMASLATVAAGVATSERTRPRYDAPGTRVEAHTTAATRVIVELR